MSNIVDILIQEKFKELLEAKKVGKLYDFRKELKNEIISKKEDNFSISQKKSMEKILKEMESFNLKSDNLN